jgi:hypothetical protein
MTAASLARLSETERNTLSDALAKLGVRLHPPGGIHPAA